jgi:hypothetical protein
MTTFKLIATKGSFKFEGDFKTKKEALNKLGSLPGFVGIIQSQKV